MNLLGSIGKSIAGFLSKHGSKLIAPLATLFAGTAIGLFFEKRRKEKIIVKQQKIIQMHEARLRDLEGKEVTGEKLSRKERKEKERIISTINDAQQAIKEAESAEKHGD